MQFYWVTTPPRGNKLENNLGGIGLRCICSCIENIYVKGEVNCTDYFSKEDWPDNIISLQL